MKKWVLAAAAALGFAGSADAAVITLLSQTNNGPSNFTWTYQGTLGPDEGVRSGDRLVIFDFAGYIQGSVFSSLANVNASVENVTAGALLAPGQTDDPNLVNLVFTYTGPDFQVAGGPFAPIDFNGLGARSIYSVSTRDAFFTQTTKNNPPGEQMTPTYQIGLVQVPAVPEPATWAMMIGGFGLIGAAMRRRPTLARVSA
jgi:hypothetical protein